MISDFKWFVATTTSIVCLRNRFVTKVYTSIGVEFSYVTKLFSGGMTEAADKGLQ